MKKSEFERQRDEHWQSVFAGDLRAGTVAELVRRDVAAAEAAGIVWEPEAPALPERLEVSGNNGYIFCRQGGGEAFFLAIISEHGKWDACFTDPALIQATWAEAVRRYNAWPALRAWAEGPDGPLTDAALARFLAILDGPAE
jgi:hypothetical protein